MGNQADFVSAPPTRKAKAERLIPFFKNDDRHSREVNGAVELASGRQFIWEFSHLDQVCFEEYL
ncbi:MAG: hypothetical protein BRC51_07755 [Cyanobacteria bacterium SW_12_48_29]|nr:MAG: hypothetical protein BRC37_00320 [Cyanobacteria bacterium QH_3_48_40]PSP04326.1 MAG: hypothetical protein BRC51_07755 [Cyanobacteria bacterium SW_12_48_29]